MHPKALYWISIRFTTPWQPHGVRMHAFDASTATSALAGHGYKSRTPHPPLPTPSYQQTTEQLLRQTSSMDTIINVMLLGEPRLILTRLIVFMTSLLN